VLNTVFWTATLVGILAMLAFTWRSAMRRRGFKLVALLRDEGLLRQAVDVPVRLGTGGTRALGVLERRGSLVLTRKRIAGFSHRARFVLVRQARIPPGVVRADGEWLLITPPQQGRQGQVTIAYRVDDPDGWVRDATRVLRGS
jgi:hypothetical protein